MSKTNAIHKSCTCISLSTYSTKTFQFHSTSTILVLLSVPVHLSRIYLISTCTHLLSSPVYSRPPQYSLSNSHSFLAIVHLFYLFQSTSLYSRQSLCVYSPRHYSLFSGLSVCVLIVHLFFSSVIDVSCLFMHVSSLDCG